MKIGDVVRVKWCGVPAKNLGMVGGTSPRFLWPWIVTLDGTGCLGELDQAWIVKLTLHQRSIVNAAVAAEALRRMQ